MPTTSLTTVFDCSGSVTRRPIGSTSPHSSFAAASADQHRFDVAVGDVAAAQERDAHRAQVARRDLAHLDRRLVARQQLGLALDHDRLHRAALRRQVVDRAGGLDARQRAQALQRGVEEGAHLRRRGVARLRQPHAASSGRCADRSRRRRCAARAGCGASRRAHQQHDRQRHLARRSAARRVRMPDRPASLRPPSFSASFRSVRPARIAGSAPARSAGEDRCGDDEQQDAAVDRDLVGARNLSRRAASAPAARLARASSRPAAPPAIASTSASISSCWKTRRAPRAERRADRDLLAASERAREEQVADVGARDQQHERDRGEQHHQRHADVADDQLLQRDDGGAPAGVLLRILALEPHRDRFHLGFRLREVTPGFRRATTCSLWLSRTARSGVGVAPAAPTGRVP